MRKEMLGAISAFALMTGAAFAQDTSTTTDPMQASPSANMQSETAPAAGTGAAETNMGATEAPATSAAPGAATEGGMAGSASAVSAEEMMGKSVLGSDGQEIGEVADVIVDPSTGQARQVILSRGGILGLGEKQVAVDFSEFRPTPDGEALEAASLTADQVEQMPEFEYEDGTVSVNRPGNVGAVTE